VVKLKENKMAMPTKKETFKFVDVSPPEAADQLLVPKEKKVTKPKRRPLTKSLKPKQRPGDVRDNANRGKTF
tara:strand:- start:102 stop:317 length:216 start_codon:yes stop_codon:yes gene_type:complete